MSALKPSHAAVLALLALSVGFHFWLGGVGDKGWELLVARMMLGGKHLYRDIFEANPPLIFWLYCLPEFLALHLGLFKDAQWLALMGFAVAAGSLALSARLADLRRAELLLLAAVFLLWTSPAYFADREDTFLMLTFPYLLRFMPSLAQAKLPLALKVAVGLLAGLGFCIKPHCAIVFAGIQLIVIWRTRSFRVLRSPENLCIYLCFALYAAAVFAFTPEYFTQVLPVLLATYSGNHRPFSKLFFFLFALFTFAVTFVDFRWKEFSPYRGDILYFLVLLPFYLLYALLNNGWGYTWHPLMGLLLFLTGLVFFEQRRLTHERAAFGVNACLFNFALATAVAMAGWFAALTARCEDYPGCLMDREMTQVIQGTHAPSFAAIEVSSFDSWPYLVRTTGASFETRFYQLWMLPAFLAPSSHGGAHEDMQRSVADDLAEDLQQRRPQLVFVEKGEKADLVAYFSRFPAFVSAWGRYRLLEPLNTCPKGDRPPRCRYEVFERKP